MRPGSTPECADCARTAARRCARCERPLCRSHAPARPGELCPACEAEYRPFSPLNAGIRVVVTAAGTAAAACLALILAGVFATTWLADDPVHARVLVMAATILGSAFGFGYASVWGAALIRSRFVAKRPRASLPAARLARPRREAPGARAGAASKWDR